VKLFQELNRDQLKGLSNLSFDLAKGQFIFVIVPTLDPNVGIIVLTIRIILALLTGIAFTIIGVLLLKSKE